jgi:hypothetical protein
MGASKSGKGFGEMNWFAKYVIERNGFIPLLDACQKNLLVAFIVETSSVFGVIVGQA